MFGNVQNAADTPRIFLMETPKGLLWRKYSLYIPSQHKKDHPSTETESEHGNESPMLGVSRKAQSKTGVLKRLK